MNKAIITVVGKDTVGIITKVCIYLAGNQIDIPDISQTIVQGYFDVMTIMDVGAMTKFFGLVPEGPERVGEEIGAKAKIQREGISAKMHRIWFRFRRKPAIRRSQGSTESFIRKGQQDMINTYEANETSNTIECEKLDMRTITLGIGLLDCVDGNLGRVNENTYRKITTLAKDLAATGRDIERGFGIPIVNKRISVTSTSLVGGAVCRCPEDFVTIARALDKAAKEVGINFIGGYSALANKGMTTAERNLILSIPQVLAETKCICSPINVGSTKTGLNMDAVEFMGRIVKETAEVTRDNDSLDCVKLVIFCNAPDDNPFMVGVFHGVIEANAVINAGASGPGAVKAALEKTRGENFEALYEMIEKTAFKITHVGQLVAQEASRCMGIPLDITDPSLAPTPSVGDSAAEILEEIGLERAGASGITVALAMLNDQVKKGGVMASSYVGGLDDAFIPVSEDQGMIDAVSLGALTFEKLEAMTCVYSVEPDMIAIPGDTPSTTTAGIIADEVAIGMINQKTTTVCPIPMIGKKVGDTAELGGLLGYAPIIPVNTFFCEKFVTRGGRIPAPTHSFKN